MHGTDHLSMQSAKAIVRVHISSRLTDRASSSLFAVRNSVRSEVLRMQVEGLPKVQLTKASGSYGDRQSFQKLQLQENISTEPISRISQRQ